MQFVQCHAVTPDGCPALNDHQRAAGDIGQRRERLGGGDGGGDGDGVDDVSSYSVAPTIQDWIADYFFALCSQD